MPKPKKYDKLLDKAKHAMLKYNHPPVTEAVIELRFKDSVNQDILKKIATKLNNKFYPNSKENVEINFNVEIGNPDGGDKSSAQLTPNGYRLSSEDQADVALITSQAFTIARLAPYPGWDTFFDKFAAAWKTWKGIVKVQEISRVGIRYINRIDIPLNGTKNIELGDFLNFISINCFFQTIPMSDYLIKITKETESPLWAATVISAPHPSPLLETISLILDIDIYRTEEIPLNDIELFKMLTEARDIKNSIFTQCITKKTEELFS